MNTGWIKVYRSLLEHPLWLAGRFTRGQAWIDLLLLANYLDSRVLLGIRFVALQRGQLCTSMVVLAARWRWNRKTVRTFLDTLQRDGMLEFQAVRGTGTGYTIITLRNYDRYQSPINEAPDIGLINGMAIDGTSSGLPAAISKKEKKMKKVKKNHTSEDGFNEFLGLFPRKENTEAAQREWTRLSPDGTLRARIMKALEEQRSWPQWLKEDGKYIPHPANWLRDKRWDDHPPASPFEHTSITAKWAQIPGGPVAL